MSRNFRDEMVSSRRAKNPAFDQLLGEAKARRALAKKLSSAREKRKLSQTIVAAAMRTSQSVISKLEAGADVRVSTLQRYCAAIGVPWPTIAPESKSGVR